MAFTLWSLTLVIWVFVSILCATAAIFAFMQPFWVVNHAARKSFGLYGFCVYKEAEPSGPDMSSPWLDPLTGSIVDVIVVDGGGFEVVGGGSNNNNSLALLGNIFNATSLANQTTPSVLPPSIAATAQQQSSSTTTTVTSCGTMFGTYFHFSDLFTSEPAWKAVGTFYATATVFLCIAAIVSVVIMFLNEFDLNVRRLCRIAGLVQLGALGLFILSIAIFPAIMTSSTASTFCPAHTISVNFPPPIYGSTLPPTTTKRIPELGINAFIDFETGNLVELPEETTPLPPTIPECHFGWAFVLASMNCLIVVFLPILSHFVVTEPDILGDMKITNL